MPVRASAVLSALVLLVASALPARGQTRPVLPYDVSGRYRTFDLGLQVTGGGDEGRDLMASWGRLRALGRSGAWMPRLEVSAGLTARRGGVEQLLLGPRLAVGKAFPGLNFGMGRDGRAEPYLAASGTAYGTGVFRGDDDLGLTPAAAAGVGFRILADEWDTSLTSVEFLVEKRWGMGQADPQLYVRFGQAVPRRAGRPGG